MTERSQEDKHHLGPPSWLMSPDPKRPNRDQVLRRRAIALAALLLLVILLITAIGSCGSGESKPKPPPTTTKKIRTPEQLAAEQAAKEDAAINHVLSYTPFIARGSAKKREIALTFDDGPGPYTPDILKILKKYKTPATFFVVGQQLNDFGALLTQEVQEGFVVANHTENHPRMSDLSRADQKAQLLDDTSQMRKYGAPKPNLFRPPYRLFNDTTLKLLKKMNMLMVLWTIDTEDYKQPGVDYIINQAVGRARPGAIILMHDAGGAREQTVAALPKIIKKLKAKGYKLVSIPQLVMDDPPPKNQKIPKIANN